MKKLALVLLACLITSVASAQPVTTKPSVSNLLTQCLANVPVVGNGAAVSPICHASGALGVLAFTTPGTGVATALGVNVGTAGALIVNGGALGSPSSVGTMPAFTLGGAVSGGGNQINNVIIGTSTPLAGTFTTVTTGVAAVGSLPTCNAGAKGARYFVTDANSTTFMAAAVGGSTNNVPVVCDGTSWKVGANDSAPAWMVTKAA